VDCSIRPVGIGRIVKRFLVFSRNDFEKVGVKANFFV
jgi:hypothetical protein